jgi:type IV pilus assembly protein PilE
MVLATRTHPNRSCASRAAGRGERGVSLLELMIVVLIVGVLASLATASYRKYSMRANRTDASTTLLQLQVAQEKFFLQNNTYATSVATAVAAPPAGLGMNLTAGGVTPGGWYVITIASTGPTQYTVTATATGTQTSDTGCLVYTINQQGTRTPTDASGCWH